MEATVEPTPPFAVEHTRKIAEAWTPAPPAEARSEARPVVGPHGGAASSPDALRGTHARATERAPGALPSELAPMPPSWAGELLSTDGDWRALTRRGLFGVGLAAVYGVALGARDGGLAILVHAAGVPAALVAVSLVGLPALYIALAFFDAPLAPKSAAGAAVRGLATSGLVLAGLSPLAALYVVTSESTDAAATAGAIGLVVGGALGLRHLLTTLRAALESADNATRFVATVAQVAFGLFSVVLAWRVWSGLLPLVGGAS